jgi:phage terminase small subunit
VPDEIEIKLKTLPKAFEGLTRLQQAFCEILVDNPAITQRQALIKAGSGMTGESADVYACKLLKKDRVKGYIKHLRAKSEVKIEKKASDAIAELARIGFANIQDFITDDNEIVDLSKIPRDTAAAIASVETTAGTKRVGRKVKFTSHNKVTALKEFLDRLQGRPKQQLDVKTVILKRELTAEEAKALLVDNCIPDNDVLDGAIAT